MRNILFITTVNLASNPRLVKELSLAVDAGFQTSVLQFRLDNWSDHLTEKLQQQFPSTEFNSISAGRQPFAPWLFSSLLQNCYRYLPRFLLNTKRLSVAIGKRSWLLNKWLSQKEKNYDWVIAHNPAAFYPAYVFSKTNKAKLGIDVEDYHPGETMVAKEQEQMLQLMRRILPKATYCSYAAPLIAKEVQKHIRLNNHQLVILNGFPASEFVSPGNLKNERLKLVWFSQNIDFGRGLEEVVGVVNDLHDVLELHLIGKMQPAFAISHLKNKNGIILHEPMPQSVLHAFLANCDVGLATDIPVNENRELALPNKILAYAQAGLYIFSFPNRAQVEFLNNYRLHHVIANNEPGSIREAFLHLASEDPGIKKSEQYEMGKQFDWATLNKPLLKTWQHN